MIIMPGVNIGDYSVVGAGAVGAGAVVTADVPSRTLVAGNQARKIGTLQAPTTGNVSDRC